jgi:hypothetical protein
LRIPSLLLLVAFSLAKPAHAQEAATSVSIPFDPPIGETFGYHLKQTYFGTAGPSGSESEQMLTFQPNGGSGFLLTVTDPGMGTGGYKFGPDGRPQRLSSIQDVAALLVPSVTIEVDQTGRFVRVQKWEQFRENFRRMPELALQTVPDELTRQRIRAMMRETPDITANLTPESASGPAAPLWSKIFGFGGQQLIPGQARTWSQSRSFLGGAAEVRVDYSLTLVKGAGESWNIDFRQIETPEGFAAAVQSALASPDQTKVAEARQIAANFNLMAGVVGTRKLRMTLDEHGMVIKGTYDTRNRTPAGIEAGTIAEFERIGG